MAYEIEYQFDSIKYTPIKPGRTIKATILLTIALLTGIVLVYFMGTVSEIFLFGGEKVPAAAEQLVEDLSSGIELDEAVQAFCAELSQ